MKVGIRVRCTRCEKAKAPHGRSIPMGHEDSWCNAHSGCAGYAEDPQAGCLWPGETSEEFGYPACDDATKEREER